MSYVTSLPAALAADLRLDRDDSTPWVDILSPRRAAASVMLLGAAAVSVLLPAPRVREAAERMGWRVFGWARGR